MHENRHPHIFITYIHLERQSDTGNGFLRHLTIFVNGFIAFPQEPESGGKSSGERGGQMWNSLVDTLAMTQSVGNKLFI